MSEVKTKKRKGRPKTRTEMEIKAIQKLICLQISTSSKSIQNILKELAKEIEKVPALSLVMDWLSKDKDFQEQYARAKEEQCEFLAEELLDIADDSSLDLAFTDEGKPFVDKEHINRSRLRVDTRKWILSKLKPKKYGDKIDMTHDVGGNVADLMRAHLAGLK